MNVPRPRLASTCLDHLQLEAFDAVQIYLMLQINPIPILCTHKIKNQLIENQGPKFRFSIAQRGRLVRVMLSGCLPGVLGFGKPFSNPNCRAARQNRFPISQFQV
jgi:hypothetical protein